MKIDGFVVGGWCPYQLSCVGIDLQAVQAECLGADPEAVH